MAKLYTEKSRTKSVNQWNEIWASIPEELSELALAQSSGTTEIGLKRGDLSIMLIACITKPAEIKRFREALLLTESNRIEADWSKNTVGELVIKSLQSGLYLSWDQIPLVGVRGGEMQALLIIATDSVSTSYLKKLFMED